MGAAARHSSDRGGESYWAPQRLEQLSAAINRDLRACGCVEAAVLCTAALISIPWLGIVLWARLPEHWLALSALGFGYVFAAALLGKIGGLLWAEGRLSRNSPLAQSLVT